MLLLDKSVGLRRRYLLLNSLVNALTSFITTFYATTGLVGIIVMMAAESCLIPLPSEIVMPLAGIMIQQHKILAGVPLPLSLVIAGLTGAFGCLLGSLAAYGIGYKGGRPLVLKYGRYVLISQHDADKADEFFNRWGSATAFFSRLLPVVRTYISLPAGISKMPLLKFCIYTFLGSFPWCVVLAYLGTVVGDNLEVLSPVFHTFDLVIGVVLVLLLVLYVWRHFRNDSLARVAHALDEAKASSTGPLSQVPASATWGQGAQGQQPWGPNAQQGTPAPQNRAQGAPGPAATQMSPTQPGQQWGQQPPPPQQPQQWGQQPPAPQQPQQWGQQPQAPQQPQWGQQPPAPQQPQQWGQQPPAPQQPQWGQQQPQQWPPQSDDNRIYRR
jgi:membrane protein DedA with SNARE-associated domain